MNDKKFENVRSGKSFWYKEIIFGIIFLIIVFVGSAQVDKKAAKSQVNSTISYVKTQCSIYARYNDATETKTLMRVIGNTQQVNRDIEFCGSELDVEALKKYVPYKSFSDILQRQALQFFVYIFSSFRNLIRHCCTLLRLCRFRPLL